MLSGIFVRGSQLWLHINQYLKIQMPGLLLKSCDFICLQCGPAISIFLLSPLSPICDCDVQPGWRTSVLAQYFMLTAWILLIIIAHCLHCQLYFPNIICSRKQSHIAQLVLQGINGPWVTCARIFLLLPVDKFCDIVGANLLGSKFILKLWVMIFWNIVCFLGRKDAIKKEGHLMKALQIMPHMLLKQFGIG